MVLSETVSLIRSKLALVSLLGEALGVTCSVKGIVYTLLLLIVVLYTNQSNAKYFRHL